MRSFRDKMGVSEALWHVDSVIGLMGVLYKLDFSDTERVPVSWYVRGKDTTAVYQITVTEADHKIVRVR